MQLSDYVAARLEQVLTEHFKSKAGDAYSQKEMLEEIQKRRANISQSVLSRLMNRTYQINNSDNKVLRNVAVFLKKDAETLWQELIEGFGEKSIDAARLKIGIPTTATFTAPLINAIDNDFPDWLDLSHTHDRNIYKPLIIKKGNHEEKLFMDEAHKEPRDDAYADCYMSGDLPQLLFHEDKSYNTGKRCFDAILCPDDLIKKRSTSDGPVFKLTEDQNHIFKVATITHGFSGLACLFEIRPRLANEKLQSDLDVKNYHIQYVPEEFGVHEIHDDDTFTIEQSKQGHFNTFLRELKSGNINADFRIYGFESSASFKTFIQFLEENFQKRTGNADRDDWLEKLYAFPPQPIDFSKDNKETYIEIAAAIREGKKILLIGYSPYMHNTWQMVANHLELDKTEYVHLTRFNFSQWLGKNSFSLYLAKSSYNRENVKKLHELLKLISKKWNDIESNMKLDSFFFYIKKGQNHRESRRLFKRACQEMGFTGETDLLVNYSKEFINYLMESEFQ